MQCESVNAKCQLTAVKEVSIMKFEMDIKSFVIGVLVTACLFVALGASKSSKPPGPVNRFQIAGNPGHVFIIDSATGQVWEKFSSPTQGSSVSGFGRPILGEPIVK